YIVKKFCLPLLLLVSFSFVHAATVVETHGALSVKGNQIINQHGSPAAFAGPSLFWSNTGWNGDRFYHAGVVTYLQREWNATIIRASMGTEKNGGYEQYP